jgi:hypothetical protein
LGLFKALKPMTLEQVKNRDMSRRPETIERIKAASNTPERKAIFKKVCSKITKEMRSQSQKNVTPEVAEVRTRRILAAHKAVLSDPIKKQKYVESILDNRKPMTPEQYQAAGIAAEKANKINRQNPEWREWDINRMREGNAASGRMKVPRTDYPSIISRRNNGETYTSIAKDYGCDPVFIRAIVVKYGKKGGEI